MPMGAHVEAEGDVGGLLLSWPTFYCWRQFSLNQKLMISGSLGGQRDPWICLSLPPGTGVTGTHSHARFYMGTGDSNACSLACTASILTTEPPPKTPRYRI